MANYEGTRKKLQKILNKSCLASIIRKCSQYRFVYITGLHQTAFHLASRAAGRVQHTFRPATKASYHRKVRLFLVYCCFVQVQVYQLTIIILLSFLEFLMEKGISNSAMANHISPVKASLAMYGVSTIPFYE